MRDAEPVSQFTTAAPLTAAGSVPRLGYVPALDGLRGIAIALVVANHFYGYPPGGLVGVDLFFVLSGFLITSLILDERAARGAVSIKDFYMRRARRLFPALGAMLIAYVLVVEAADHNGFKTAALGGLYFGNVVQAFNLAPVRHSPLLHLWSLAEEEQFYLLWPWLLLLIARSRHVLRWLVALLALMVAYKVTLTVGTHPSWVRLYFGPDTHAEGLVCGALLAVVRVRRGGLNVREWFGKLGVVALAFGVIFGRQSVNWVSFGLPLFELGLIFLIAASVGDTALAKGLQKRPLVGLGKISYSLYLWHPPVWFALVAVVPLSRHATAPLAISLSLLVAWLSYRYIEQPFRRRRDARLEQVESIPSAAATS
jgi:peptidoglycan/LPS O-acetylase OafA/YrhL